MTRSRLPQKLETYAGEEDLEFIVPYPLLPPRFYKASRGRNMLLQVSVDLQIFIGWEGSRIADWSVLTPRAARALLRDVIRKMGHYKQDVEIFSKFLYENAMYPAPDPVFDDPSDRAVPEEAEMPTAEGSPDLKECGGESPWPTQEF